MSDLVKIIKPEDIDKYVVADKFNEIINQNPPKNILQTHPTASGVKYIAIDKIELLMTKIFTDWYVEVLKTGQLLNSIETIVRLNYYHPVHKEWRHQDGVGAVPIQTDKGKNASDMGAIKSNAIMLALPAAKSYAIKDAAENIGRIFGRDINRKDTFAFSGDYKKSADEQKEEIRRRAEGTDESS